MGAHGSQHTASSGRNRRAGLDESESALTVAESVWGPWETTITSFSKAIEVVDAVAEACNGREIVWRGMVDASWPLHNSLSRKVAKLTGSTPKEEVLQTYEVEILRRCRQDWRFDKLPALELLAHLQHYGGPTRLIDVTLNPLVALWFAVEQQREPTGKLKPESDGRLFAFSYRERISLDSSWGTRDLPWLRYTATKNEWGRSGNPPRVWVSPSYNERISAQNAGFLIAGTPASWGGRNTWRKAPGSGTGTWSINTVRDASSLYVNPSVLGRKPQQRSSFPTYNFKIATSAKAAIRRTLERTYGITTSSIYPDLFGLAQNVLPTSI